jgi:hypothetical protein
MSTLQTPRLPDVPFARAMSAVPDAPASYVLRPVSRVARFFTAMPLPLMVLLSLCLLARAYHTGTTFVHDINYAFVWVIHTAVFAALSAVVLLPAAIVLGVSWGRLSSGSRFRAAAAGVAAVVAGVMAVNYSGTAFRAGKTHAYAGVNATFLTADCRTLAAGLTPTPNSHGTEYIVGTDPSLPAYLRSLGPKIVIVSAESVEVVMAHDYFSGTDHESFVVPLGAPPADPAAYAAQKGLTVLGTQPAVFRYRKPR